MQLDPTPHAPVPPAPVPGARPWTGRWAGVLLAIVIVVLFVTASGVGSAVAVAIDAAIAGERPTVPLEKEAFYWAALGGYLAAILLGAIFRRAPGGLAGIGLRRSGTVRSIRWLLPVFVLVGLMAMAFSDEGGASLPSPGWVVRWILLAVAIGVAEEIYFRGGVVHALGGRYRPWLAVYGSSLLFGLPHLAAPAGADHRAYLINTITVVLLVGVPFAVTLLVTGNLVGPIVAHAAIDIVALLQLDDIVLPDAGDMSRLEIATQLGVGAAFAIAYSLALLRHLKRQPPAVEAP